ncbi:MAG TPA: HAD family hydrolase [Pirellulales bacterium]|jgi:beta-phosphoglucomutase-like phosphatase (HAD superfamily)
MTNEATSAGTIEVLRPDFPRGEFRAAMFDFDGTLSLIRRNWQAVMIPMMVDVLAETGSGESREKLHEHVEEYVMRLNGKQTIYQMMQLADEVKARGATPRDPLEYKHQYHDLLWAQVGQRIDALKQGRVPPDDLTVPGSRRLLTQLRDRGVKLYLASGTDLKYVRDEVAVLGLTEFFGEHIYGALDDYRSFSKAMIIEQIIRDMNVGAHQLLAFGDGFVEIEETRRAGGVAVGVASDEEARQGINAWKRERLIRAGADIIIGDYRQQDELLALLGL